MIDLKTLTNKTEEILELSSFITGVKFYFKEEEIPSDVQRVHNHRYCQALMKARRGKHIVLDAGGIACPAAAAAFGFKPLPDGLKTGKGLVGFGIVNREETGRNMFEKMPSLPLGHLKAIYLFPLREATIEPDIVVVEDETEILMWIALANLNIHGGNRIESTTAVLQAACVDATLIPFTRKQFNMSVGCYGCRDATDISHGESVLGFPFNDFEAIASAVAFLGQKAIPNSRGKNALAMLKRKEAEITTSPSSESFQSENNKMKG